MNKPRNLDLPRLVDWVHERISIRVNRDRDNWQMLALWRLKIWMQENDVAWEYAYRPEDLLERQHCVSICPKSMLIEVYELALTEREAYYRAVAALLEERPELAHDLDYSE